MLSLFLFFSGFARLLCIERVRSSVSSSGNSAVAWGSYACFTFPPRVLFGCVNFCFIYTFYKVHSHPLLTAPARLDLLRRPRVTLHYAFRVSGSSQVITASLVRDTKTKKNEKGKVRKVKKKEEEDNRVHKSQKKNRETSKKGTKNCLPQMSFLVAWYRFAHCLRNRQPPEIKELHPAVPGMTFCPPPPFFSLFSCFLVLEEVCVPFYSL